MSTIVSDGRQSGVRGKGTRAEARIAGSAGLRFEIGQGLSVTSQEVLFRYMPQVAMRPRMQALSPMK